MLPGGQAHYLGTVLRRDAGALVRVFNGVDGEYLARIAAPARRGSTLTVVEKLRDQPPETGPWLLFALLKRDATDLVVRQAVELGASRILPVITERTNAARVNEDRLRAIVVEAAEQCERLTLPPVDTPARLDAILTRWPVERRLFAALERHDPPPGLSPSGLSPSGLSPSGLSPSGLSPPGPAALLIGPEGGFTAGEQTWLLRLPFVTPISLGPNVLRAETAAAAGQALLLGMGWAD